MKTEEKNLLSAAKPITRKWLAFNLQNRADLDEILGSYHYLNLVEGNIYRRWHQNCLAEMKRVKLNECIPDLFHFVALPEVTMAQALAKTRKKYACEQNKNRQKQIGKMVAMLTALDNSERRLYREATEKLLNGKTTNVLEKIAARIENADEILNEYRLFTRQSIKHYNRLVQLGTTPSVHELYQCLDARFAGDAEIFTKQVNIVCATYKEGQDVPAEIKNECFNFIADSLQYAGYMHANLIDYIFKNDEITERAFELFCSAEKQIREHGMMALPAMRAHTLAVKKGLYDKPAAELSDSDVRILRIEHMFKQ